MLRRTLILAAAALALTACGQGAEKAADGSAPLIVRFAGAAAPLVQADKAPAVPPVPAVAVPLVPATAAPLSPATAVPLSPATAVA